MRTPRNVGVVVAGALLLTGCGGPPGDAGRVDQALVAELGPGEAAAVGQAVDAFGFDLFKKVADGRTNTVTSPLSVAVLLAMLLAGAEGGTADEIARVLHLSDPRDVRAGALLREVADTDDVTLSVANSVWAGGDFPIEEDFQAYVRKTFGASVERGDLGSADTAKRIDEWVDDNTNGLIKGIAEELGLPSSTVVAVLLNAVYFLGEWSTPFDPTATQPSTFAGAGAVPTMRLTDETFGHVQRDGYRMLRMPYGEDGRYAMEIMLPDQDSSLPALIGTLDAAEWTAATGSLAERNFDRVTLPRFELRWKAELTGVLQQMGIRSAFASGEGFRPMSPAMPALSKVVHKTYIRVDEKGTEAAAVTGGAMVLSAPAQEELFLVDRPFAFTVSDRRTGTILFLGAVTDPAAAAG